MNKKQADNLTQKRKKYSQLKSDPKMYETERKNERIRYLKKKERGQVIPISKKSPRDQR